VSKSAWYNGLFSRFETKVFLLALAVRLLFVVLYPGINYYGGITGEYLDVVNNILSGHGLTQYVDIAPYDSGRVQMEYMPFVARPLGYVTFLTIISFFTGIAPVAYQIVQALITAFSAVLVYRLVKILFLKHERVNTIAKTAAVLAAVWPNQARFEITILPDGPTTLIMLGFAYQLTMLAKTGERKHLIYSAIILATSILLRPDFVLFPSFFIFAAILLFGYKRAIVQVATLAAMLAVMIGLNTWKNYAISGEIVPLNLGSGTTMYEGISQFGDTLGTTYADDRVAHNKLNSKELFYPNGPKNDRMLFNEAVEIIKANPGFYAKLLIKRIPLMFTVRGLYFSDSVSFLDPNQDLAKRFPDKYIDMAKTKPVELTVRMLSPALGWLLVILGFWGLIKALRHDWRTHIMITALLLYWILSHLATNVEPRYFYPAVPLLYGYAVYLIYTWRTRKKAIHA
jgi:4-amino-4-deoxy-L-arabinose transferase-like glycosyltransferase